MVEIKTPKSRETAKKKETQAAARPCNIEMAVLSGRFLETLLSLEWRVGPVLNYYAQSLLGAQFDSLQRRSWS